MSGSMFVAALVALFTGVSTGYSTITTQAEAVSAVSVTHDTVADGSSPEYTYSVGKLTEAKYNEVMSGAHVEAGSVSGSGILVLEYSDFSCTYCQTLQDQKLFSSLQKSFPDIAVKHVAKYFSIFDQEAAITASKLAMCAGSLGNAKGYYETSSALFKAFKILGTQAFPTDRILPQVAKQIGVSKKKVQTCMDEEKTAEKFGGIKSEFTALGFSGTPSILLIDERTLEYVPISGAYSNEYFGSAVVLLLSRETATTTK